MNESYQPHQIEPDVQSRWETEKTFSASEDSEGEKFYSLCMFPYPSGKLHMGHVRNYTIGDVIARFQRLLGKNVLQPIGWDAFGLPAENAAIERGVAPAKWTYQNIDDMRGQLKRLGFAYDWDREVTTCDPDYYRWEQWMFTRLYRKGLVYKKNSVVNWDPVDQTVLANEQVVDGRGWRSGALVEQREIPQWFLKITAYADELLDELDNLTGWPDAVRTMQRHWIGRSHGLGIDFDVDADGAEPLSVYTTRPDTLFGVSYMAVAPEHPLARRAAENDPKVAEFIEQCKHQQTSERELETAEKRGMALGIDAIHPLSGKKVPVWVANFVLMSYGTGAVMSVPAHDERDWEFARAYGLPILPVIASNNDTEHDYDASAMTERGKLMNSDRFDGLDFEKGFEALATALGERAEKQTNYRLRDWGVSRQRYWGCPIPMIHCPSCGEVPVPDEDLPVRLPEDVSFDGVTSPLKSMDSFRQCQCPSCGGDAERETDTFDTFMESSWYFARYCSPDNDQAMLDDRAKQWLPVNQYIGGIEHAVMHLLYARFYQKLLRDEGLADAGEPFTNLLTQGMVVAETFYREEGGRKRFFNPGEIEVQRDEKGRVVGATLQSDGLPVTVGGIEKMSKSKNNGVDPQAMIDRFGADTVRLFSMFAAPPEQSLEWSDQGVEGAHRFLNRLWRQVHEHVFAGVDHAPRPKVDALNDAERDLRRKAHETLAKVTHDMRDRYHFNTAIAAVMELLNAVSRFQSEGDQAAAVVHEALELAVLMLSPITPHIGEALWQALGHSDRLVDAQWPVVDEAALKRDSLELVVQINGKLRGRIEVPAEADREAVEKTAMEDSNVQRHITDKTVRKVIVVPGKLVNIVVS
jgi:leucyl-tRNA synthetase